MSLRSYNKNKINSAVEDVENSINYMMELFADKQDLNFVDYADEHLGIAHFDVNYWLNVSDILYDLKTDQPKGRIIEWNEKATEYQGSYCTYKAYTLGKIPKRKPIDHEYEFFKKIGFDCK